MNFKSPDGLFNTTVNVNDWCFSKSGNLTDSIMVSQTFRNIIYMHIITFSFSAYNIHEEMGRDLLFQTENTNKSIPNKPIFIVFLILTNCLLAGNRPYPDI